MRTEYGGQKWMLVYTFDAYSADGEKLFVQENLSGCSSQGTEHATNYRIEMRIINEYLYNEQNDYW